MRKSTAVKTVGVMLVCLITLAACAPIAIAPGNASTPDPSEVGPGIVRLQGPEAAVLPIAILLVIAAVGYLTWRLAAPDEAWIAAHAPAQPHGLVALVRQHPLLSYFVLTYAITWLFWLPTALAQSSIGLLPIRVPLALMTGGGFGPIGAAYITTAITSGRAGVRHLMRRIVLWRVGFQWWVFALVGLPLLLWLGMVLAFPNALAAFSLVTLPATLSLFAMAFLFQLIQSGLFEEVGWRGFAQPRLQDAYGALRASVILGLLWGFWHLPLFLIPGLYVAASDLIGIGVPFVMSLGMAVVTSIVFTWVFNHTKGSVLMAIMLHASMNAAGAALQSAVSTAFPNATLADLQFTARLIGFGLFALVIFALSRGQLGYHREPSSAPKEAHQNAA